MLTIGSLTVTHTDDRTNINLSHVAGPPSILGKLCEYEAFLPVTKLTPYHLQWQANNHTQNLTVMIVNRDSTAANSLGSAILSAGMANANGSSTYGSKVGRLGFYEGDLQEYPDEESVRHAVLENEIWGVIVGKSDHSRSPIMADDCAVNEDATAHLQTARETGNALYNPRFAIDFYYNQARMENAVNGYLVPLTTSVLTQAMETWSAQSVAS